MSKFGTGGRSTPFELLLFYQDGFTASEMVNIFGYNENTVYKYRKHYDKAKELHKHKLMLLWERIKAEQKIPNIQ